MGLLSNIVQDNKFTPEDVPKFEAKLFFEGAKRRKDLEQFSVLLFLSTVIATYGVLGDQVNLAARLMLLARPGEILASREVQAAVAGEFQWELLPPHHLTRLRDTIAPNIPAPLVDPDELNRRLAHQAELLAEPGEGTVEGQALMRSLRTTFETGRIVHLRPSGNAPEFRIYTEAEDKDVAHDILAMIAERLRQTLRPA